jgi:hypothetical protein
MAEHREGNCLHKKEGKVLRVKVNVKVKVKVQAKVKVKVKR